jgi:hypothetical protein
MPRRPEFDWMNLVYALVGVSMFGFFLTPWLFSLNFEAIDYTYTFSLDGLSNHITGILSMFSLDGLSNLITGISSGTVATLIGLAAMVLLFLPEKLKLLYRTI